MGKKLIVQRRGRGSPTFRANTHKRKGAIKYRKISRTEMEGVIKAKVVGFEHEPGRGAPLAKVIFEDGLQKYILPAEGLALGDTIEYGAKAEIKPGNTLPLFAIPARTMVYNIELQPGDGGKLVRASGSSAVINSKEDDWVYIQLPSGRIKAFPSSCRATIGVVAGGGRTQKPFVKAGNKHYHMKAKGHNYPRVRGTAMNAVSHPHGGGSHQRPGGPTTVSRNAPPGQKVGLIAARRTGKKVGRQAKERQVVKKKKGKR